MKKDHDYSQTEKWLSEQFPAAEKHLKYNGRALEKIDNKTRRGSVLQYPAVRIAGAFLVLLLIGGSLFGTLKFLEYKGTKINTSYSAETGDDEVITYVKGNTDKENRYLAVKADKTVYYPNVYLISNVKQLPSGKTDYTNYSIERLDAIDIPYGDGFSIVNNVSDREMTVRSVAIYDPADERAVCIPLYTDLDGLYDHLSKSSADKIMAEIDVTWDTGDEIYVYNVIFNVIKEKSAQNEAVLLSDINGIKTYDYEKKLEKLQKAPYDGDPCDLVRVLTGGELYTVPVSHAYDMEHLTAVKHYDSDSDPAVIEFGGDLELYNNAADKDMQIISVSVAGPDGKTSSGTVQSAFRTVYTGKAGVYVIKACVSWDKSPDASSADKYSVYCVYFALRKAEDCEDDGRSWYEEEQKNTKYRYLAVSNGNKLYYPPVVCTKYVKRVSDASTVQKVIGSDLSKYKEIRIPYGGALELLNNVYDKEKMTVVSMTVKNDTDTEAEALDTVDMLNEYLEKAGPGAYRVSLELSWDTYPVLNKGDQAYVFASSFYVDRSDDTPDTSFDETTAEESSEQPEQTVEFDPSGKLRIFWNVKNNPCKVYYPPVLQKRVYKDGSVTQELSYESDPCDVEYRYTDTLVADNTARSDKTYSTIPWRICSVNVNKEKEFGSFVTAFEYIHELSEKSSGSVYVEATVTWDAGALISKDADRTEYTYAFNVIYTCPDDIDPKADPYVTGIMKRWLSVVIGEARYNPGISKKLTYDGDQITEFEYYHDETVLEWIPGEQIAVSNEIYTMWRVYGVTVNGEKYDKAEEAFAALPTDRVSRVEVEVSWAVTDLSVIDDAVTHKNTYIFEFYVKPVSEK